VRSRDLSSDGCSSDLPMSDSFATRAKLDVNSKSYTYASLPKLGEKFDIARLPYSMKILLENLLRHEDGGATVGKAHIEAVAKWDPKAEPDTEIAFMPARVRLAARRSGTEGYSN